MIKDERKVYTMEKLNKLISADLNSIKHLLVLAGNNLFNLNSKTELELRKMVCNYIVLSKAETSKIFDLNLDALKSIMIKLGFEEKDFAGKSRREIEDLFINIVGDKSLLSRKSLDIVKEENKSSKKVLSDKQIEELLLEEDVSKLRPRTILLGITAKDSLGKSLQELQAMIKEKIEFTDAQIINILNGSGKNLRKIVNFFGVESDAEFRCFNEEKFIEIIGIDRVIEAMAKICIEDEKNNTSTRMKFLSSLDNCRRSRGKQIFESEEFQSLDDTYEKKNFIRKLSAYEREDFEYYVKSLKSGYSA